MDNKVLIWNVNCPVCTEIVQKKYDKRYNFQIFKCPSCDCEFIIFSFHRNRDLIILSKKNTMYKTIPLFTLNIAF